MARPKKDIPLPQLKAIMRLKPSLEDTAAFFECDPSTIEKMIKRDFGLRFSEFREQNMVQTRFSLIRTAIHKAEKGDNVMLIFCLKNLCGWKDRYEQSSGDDQGGSAEKPTPEAMNKLKAIARPA